MLELKTEADLQNLVAESIEESLTLDYKASPALAKDSKKRDELCKDVSALANSAGGQIIYGIEEKDQKPVRVDEGTDITREWIEQVIDSNIQPRIEGLVITPIRLASGKAAYVLSVPQSNARGAHQAPDKKYYKRQNFQSVPMEDYEIRDVMSRSTKSDLSISFYFNNMSLTYPVRLSAASGEHLKEGLTPLIRNHSNEPVLYAVAQIGVDARMELTSPDYEGAGQVRRDGVVYNVVRLRFSPKHSMPIFKEIDTMLPSLGLRIPDGKLYDTNPYRLFYEVKAPGCAKEAKGSIFVEGGSTLRIEMDPAVHSQPTSA